MCFVAISVSVDFIISTILVVFSIGRSDKSPRQITLIWKYLCGAGSSYSC